MKSDTPRKHRILILGAGYAGLTAAIRAGGKFRKAGITTAQAEITLISASDVFVERVRLHQRATGQRLKTHVIRDLLPKQVRFVQAFVDRIDPEAHTVTTHDGVVYAYDTLVYALGSRTNLDVVEGARAYALPVEDRTLVDRLGALTANEDGRVVVVGGGLTGIETASEIADTFPQLRVSLVTSGAFGSHLSDKAQAYLRDAFTRLGIKIIAQTRALSVEQNTVITEQDVIPFDICVWATSMKPLALAKQAGLMTNAIGQIKVDAGLRSLSHPHVFAIGDAAVMTDAPIPTRMSCQLGQPQGAHTADNLVKWVQGDTPTPFDFAYSLQCISLGRHDGLVQFVTPEDQPTDKVFTGRIGKWVKEIVVRSTVWTLYMERILPGFTPIRPYPKERLNARETKTLSGV